MSDLTNDERAELEELRALKARMQAARKRYDEKKKLEPDYREKSREKQARYRKRNPHIYAASNKRHRAKKKAEKYGEGN